MSDVTLVVVAKDHADLRAFDLSNIDATEIVLIANSARTPLSVIGNHSLRCGRASVLGLVHADTWFGPGALRAFTEMAIEGTVCGIVGIDLNFRYRWASNSPGRVSTLDSCSVFLRRDLGLQFDEQLFDSLHLHVEDLCLQAERKKIPVIVPRADATHRSRTANGQAWIDEYHRYRERLCTKWFGVDFVTT